MRFVQADNAKKIHVLLLNMGMINSKTMKGKDAGNDGSVLLKDLYDKPFEAIASIKPILIIDEPHRFNDNNETWRTLIAFKPQFILRYGATFNDNFYNLIYRLTAMDAFNQDLVKGVRAFIEQIEGDSQANIKFIEKLSQNEAKFELRTKEERKNFILSVGESLNKVHPAVDDLILTNIHPKKNLVVFNEMIEVELNKSIKPYAYSNQVADKMMRQALREHFKVEQELLNRADKIKPLTLFFIDDIAGYREDGNISGSLKARFEACVKDEATKALKNVQPNSAFYHSLQTVLKDISATHGGYFSKDNSSEDEKTSQQISEILHDKESLLSRDNPRRFIFSKWTLREGWDNPNIFGICKLRSSGSETSKLQEVGRGLRLPVNEFMARVKDSNFMLNYFVDSSESDFVYKLTEEVNQNAHKAIIFDALNDALFEKIQMSYPDETKKSIRNKLSYFIDDDDKFIHDGLNQVKQLYPDAFKQHTLKQGKIAHAGKDKNKAKMREGKYDELKALWEMINQKAILNYQISEVQCQQLLVDYLLQHQDKFAISGLSTKIYQIKVNQNSLYSEYWDNNEYDEIEPIVTMNYRAFLEKLAQKSFIQMATLHRAFYQVRDKVNIEKFMNEQTIYSIHKGFNQYLLQHSFSKFQVGYEQISASVHPTKFTDIQGNPLDEINSADLGVNHHEQPPLTEFLFEQTFFDSDIERKNIVEDAVSSITVFTKIPKNSIKIPVAGGGTYSPDFAYIIESKTGETLNLVVESKGVEGSDSLRNEEQRKIEHARRWIEHISSRVNLKIIFATQFQGSQIKEIIKKALDEA